MLVVELQFPAGRYHATAWGRHVNEGEPEWPPSPYRLIRAVYDAWKRKRPEWPAARVEPILAALASAPPRFALPRATFSHTRSFLSLNTENPADRTLIFDGFAAMGRGRRLLLGWPGVALSSEQNTDLNELLSVVNFLGRSESWVLASVGGAEDGIEWNCASAWEAGASEPISVACAIPREEYSAVPGDWLNALTFSTADLISKRASAPPALRSVEYFCQAQPEGRAPHLRAAPLAEAVRYELKSKVLPPLTSALLIAERVRVNLMGAHKRIVGDPAKVSMKFSGKAADGTPLKGHQHMFVLPADEDGDGRLDHLLICCRTGFDLHEQLALDRIETLWQADGRPEVRCVPISRGRLEAICKRTRIVRSMTPFVPARHYRQGRGEFRDWLAAEIRHECANQNIGEPLSVHPLQFMDLRGGRRVRWLEFYRNRKDDAARQGFGFELEFAEPVLAPIALGYGCHFGLGQFHSARG